VRGRTLRLTVLAVWIALGLLETVKVVISRELRGFPPLPLESALVNNMPWWLAWAALTPVVLLLVRTFPLDGPRPLRALAAHAVAAPLVGLIHLIAVGSLFFYTTSRGAGPFRGPFGQVRFFVDGYILMDLLTYAAIVGTWYALDYQRRARDREVEAARLREQAVSARLDALRMELNPHFLFNALNSVAGLVREDRRRDAIAVLARLGELLRFTLDHGDDDVPLRRELALVRRYLAIEAVRFGDRLTVDIRVDPAAEDAAFPPLLLQPLVENAIRHGIRRRPGPARLTVSASVAEGRLSVDVMDDGPGFTPGADGTPPTDRRAVGLDNVRARLETRFGDLASLEILSAHPGARVRVRLPYQPAPARTGAAGGHALAHGSAPPAHESASAHA
jgi:two-component system LytT family sensor kinase